MGFNGEYAWLPCGKRLQQNYGKIHHAMKMGQSTSSTGLISMSQTVSLPEGMKSNIVWNFSVDLLFYLLLYTHKCIKHRFSDLKFCSSKNHKSDR